MRQRMNQMSDLFACLNAINFKNKKYKYNKKDCSGYMLLMWYSHDKDCMGIVADINEHLFNLPDKLVFKYLFKRIPQKKRFLKWTKGVKDKKLLKKEEAVIQGWIDLYKFSRYEAETLFYRYVR